jgi:HPt (histidine-containing phosphotransfer) domain-containing protein
MCLDAGMNDYITKPIVAAELNGILAKWLPHNKIELGKEAAHTTKKKKVVPAAQPAKPVVQQVEEVEEDEEIEEDDPLYDELAQIPGLDVEQGLFYVANSRDVYYRAMREYCEHLDERVASIRQYFAEKNWPQYEILVHGFKGIFATLGDAAISAQAKELEFASKDAAGTGAGDPAEGERVCVEKTDAALEAFLAFRARLMETSLFNEDKEKQQMSVQDIAGQLRDLQEACNDFSSSDVSRIVGEIEHTSINPEIDAALAEVLKLISEIDYDEAVEKISAILEQIPAAD